MLSPPRSPPPIGPVPAPDWPELRPDWPEICPSLRIAEKWVSVTSPSGKTSKVVLTPAGYLARITDPVGQSYTMTYQGTQGLLKTFQKPTLETSTFT